MKFKYTFVLIFSLVVFLGLFSPAQAQAPDLGIDSEPADVEVPNVEVDDIPIVEVEETIETLEELNEEITGEVADSIKEAQQKASQAEKDLQKAIPKPPPQNPPPPPPLPPQAEGKPNPQPQEPPKESVPNPTSTQTPTEQAQESSHHVHTVIIREVETITETETETVTKTVPIERTVFVEKPKPVFVTRTIKEFFESIPVWFYVVIGILTALATWAMLKAKILSGLLTTTMSRLGYEKSVNKRHTEGIISRQIDNRMKKDKS